MLWFESLTTAERETLFEAMRSLDVQAQAHWKQASILTAPTGTIAVGSAPIDNVIKASAIDRFLRQLRNGTLPEMARDNAKPEIERLITAHNRKRPKDIDWPRWIKSGDGEIDRCHAYIVQKMKPQNQRPEPKYSVGSQIYHLHKIGFWYVSPTPLRITKRDFDRLTTRPEKSHWVYSVEAPGSDYTTITNERDLRESFELALAIAAKRNHKIQYGKTKP